MVMVQVEHYSCKRRATSYVVPMVGRYVGRYQGGVKFREPYSRSVPMMPKKETQRVIYDIVKSFQSNQYTI